MAITVPGASTTTSGGNITVTPGSGDVLHLAAQIGALLATIQGGSGLNVATVTAGVSSGPTISGKTNELVYNPVISPSAVTVPAGWNYVVNNAAGESLTGTNVAITGTAGTNAAYFVSGASTVAGEGGGDTVVASGTYTIALSGVSTTGSPGNVVFGNGVGSIATGGGTSTIVAANAGNNISVGGTNDVVVAEEGGTIVNSSENGLAVIGSSIATVNGSGYTPTGTLFVSVTGGSVTASAGNLATSVTATGANDVLFGGTSTAYFLVSGLGDTIGGSTTAGSVGETVSAATGGSNPIVFGGQGLLSFVGGGGTATIVGGGSTLSGSTYSASTAATVGSGGVVFSAGSNDASTVTSGLGTASIFGGSGSMVNFAGSEAGVLFLAGAGNETLNAAQSSTSNLLIGGTSTITTNAVSLVGGAGADTLYAGAGSDTLSGGSGANDFSFFAGVTSMHGGGAQDYITDWNANDQLFLVGYDSAQSAGSLLSAASATNPVTLTLSDNTRITFSNLTSTSSLTGKIDYINPPHA